MSIDYTTILVRKYPGTQWTVNAEDYDQITWLSDGDKPSKKELDDLWPIVQAEIKAEREAKAAARSAALTKLGLTADEAAALFG